MYFCSPQPHVMSVSDVHPTTWSDIPRISQQEEIATVNAETIEIYKLSDISTWLESPPTFQLRRLTTANTELEDPYKTFILFWQKGKISDRFDVLAQRKDNWDGYDSKKPTLSTLDYAKQLIEELYDYITSAGHSWLTPFISSDEDGYITAAWNKGKRALHIEIEENGAEYTKIWRTNINMKMEIDFLNRDDYLTLWEWLLDE